jgi:hypothetical protein
MVKMKSCAIPAQSAVGDAFSASFLRRLIQSQTTLRLTLRLLRNFAFKRKDASLQHRLLASITTVGP